MAVAVVPLLISSTVHALGIAAQTSAQFLNYRFLNMLVQEVTSLALLLYVLNRNGQSLGNLGFNFRARDVLHGIALIVGTWFIFAAAIWGSKFGHGLVLSRS